MDDGAARLSERAPLRAPVGSGTANGVHLVLRDPAVKEAFAREEGARQALFVLGCLAMLLGLAFLGGVIGFSTMWLAAATLRANSSMEASVASFLVSPATAGSCGRARIRVLARVSMFFAGLALGFFVYYIFIAHDGPTVLGIAVLAVAGATIVVVPAVGALAERQERRLAPVVAEAQTLTHGTGLWV
jgi:hypothetical protein